MKPNRQPNVLLVVLDDVRADHVSCYGHSRPTTPHLDQLAAQGLLFQNAISSAGWTLPSHASLFTGMHPSHHGAQDGHPFLAEQWTTLAEVFGRAGYRTIGLSNNAYIGQATGLNRGFETFVEIYKQNSPLRRLWRKGRHKIQEWLLFSSEKGAQEINRAAWAFFTGQGSGAPPFLMFINYLEPHFPFIPPRRFQWRFLPSLSDHCRARRLDQDPETFIVNRIKGYSDPDPGYFDLLTALYDAEIAFADAMLGELLVGLKAKVGKRETVIIVCSDHGENFGEHGLLGHRFCLYDTLLKVPLIIHCEERLEPAVIGRQVRLIDLFPTLLKLAHLDNVSVHQALPGKDLLDVAPEDTQSNFAVAEQSRPNLLRFRRRFPEVDMSGFDRELKALRTEQWKYIWGSPGEEELYHLPTDPAEKNNLARQEPEVTARLRGCLWGICPPIAALPGEEWEFDPATRDHLQDLGYL